MDTQEIVGLLQIVKDTVGNQALANINAEANKRLREINAELAPKPVPEPKPVAIPSAAVESPAPVERKI